MTQHQLIIEYLKQNRQIIPAKMAGKIFMGMMFGSETSKRCRELRNHKLRSVQQYPVLESSKLSKFEVFWLKGEDIATEAVKHVTGANLASSGILRPTVNQLKNQLEKNKQLNFLNKI
jgi:hypothetical protein